MEAVKKGKRTVGVYVDTGGCLIYCAYRSLKDLYIDAKRGESPTIAEGLTNGTAAWAITDTELMEARRRGCKYVAVLVKKLNWLFMTPMETFYDPTSYFRRNTGKRAESRMVSTKKFAKRDRHLKLGPTAKPCISVMKTH